MQDIKVSVACITYNHAPYIRKCLDGLVMQKTNFPFEIIVHDDASTDGTTDIVREYAAKYPDLIIPILQTENQYQQKIPNMKTHVLPRTRGMYIAFCEGDDYWCDPNKLQRQADALDANPNCHFSLHAVQVVNEDGTVAKGTILPSQKLDTGLYSSKEFISLYCNSYFFQYCSYMVRKEVALTYYENPPSYLQYAKVGDMKMQLYMGQTGEVYYFSDPMSCYRSGTVGSWNSRNQKNQEYMISHYSGLIKMITAFDEATSFEYHDSVTVFLEHYELQLCFTKKDRRAIWQKKHRREWKRFPFKKRVKILINLYFPWLKPLYHKLKGK